MNAARRGGALKVLVLLVVFALIGALAWVSVANRAKNGAWSFNVFDPDWWTVTSSRERFLDDPAASVVGGARELASKTKEALWGKDGLVQRCEEWWKGHAPVAAPTPPAEPASAPPALPADPAQARRQREQQLDAADRAFRDGLTQFKRAAPTASGSDADKREALAAARARFVQVAAVLKEALPAYQALPGSDPALVRSARQLEGYNQQLLDWTK
jgi:hypothetical protein